MRTLKILVMIGLALQLGLKLEAKNIRFGLLAGFVVPNARVANKPEIYSDYRVFYPMYSFSINGYIEYKISENWGISAEPGFIRKGGVVRFGLNHYMSSIRLTLNYIQIPVLANFYFSDRFFVSIGPEFAYLINSEENLPTNATGLSHFNENAFEVSAMIGLNYCLSIKVDIGLRYSYALTCNSLLTWTDGYGPSIGQSKVYNQYFQLLIRFKINTGGNNN